MTNQTKQSLHESRNRRAMRIIRQLAKQNGYTVGGPNGSQIDEFMAHLEQMADSGRVVIPQS